MGENNITVALKSVLKGVSQVLLIDNAWSGLLILIGLFLASWDVGLTAFVASCLGTATAYYIGANRDKIKHGLYGFSSVLTGIACLLFLDGDSKYVAALIGAVIAVFFTVAFNRLAGHFGLPSLTFPFIAVTWCIILASYAMTHVHLSDAVAVTPIEKLTSGQQDIDFFGALIKDFGEVFLQDSYICSLFILAAIVISGWRNTVMAGVGVVISIAVVYICGLNLHSLEMGLYSYNTILTMIALGSAFYTKVRGGYVYVVIGGILTVLLTPVVTIALEPLGLPALTMPFVAVTWLFLVIAESMKKGEY
ncbi:urea transporter [Listeria booriae]|uniref:urea transporter n=1 Tax=Listeria booriae TaxID=1552123 RepID=UPI001626C9BA|nr:urea transporter [Listeria booriae]MBC1292048.1 urea transporter [Listeria booriae]MBC1513254.1 urea transporter [Listeria booriae]MBC1650098.1 urea transporter [Listeria booriae]MBC2318609.1 urea transporter [Listeria booriae]MBC6152201.1 urea transporter [Listeria booriae]